jgi:CRP-like cAMP-binding protein
VDVCRQSGAAFGTIGGAEDDVQPTADDIALEFPALGRHMSDRGLEALAKNVKVVTFPAKHVLLKFGAPSDTMFLVHEGKVSVSIGTAEHSLTLGVLGSGHWVGELGVIEPGPASGDVVVEEAATLYALDSKTLERMELEDPSATAGLLQAIALSLSARIRSFSAGFLKEGKNGAVVFQQPKQKKSKLSLLVSSLFGVTGAVS